MHLKFPHIKNEALSSAVEFKLVDKWLTEAQRDSYQSLVHFCFNKMSKELFCLNLLRYEKKYI